MHTALMGARVRRVYHTQDSVSHTGQCITHRGVYHTQDSVSYTGRCITRRGVYHTQGGVSHTGQCVTHRTVYREGASSTGGGLACRGGGLHTCAYSTGGRVGVHTYITGEVHAYVHIGGVHTAMVACIHNGGVHTY